MKKVIFILLSLTSISFVYSQGINDLELLDGIAFPLARADNGIKFKYNTTSSGLLYAYLKTNSANFRLLSNKQEFKGIGYINMPDSKLLRFFFNYKTSYTSDITLQLVHISYRTNHYSHMELPLRMKVYAPYGYKFKNYPEKPNLFPLDITKKVIQPLPLIGVISGSSLLIAGLTIEIGNQKDGKVINDDKERKSNTLIAIGGLTALYSYFYLTKSVPDVEKNNQNRSINKELLYNYNQKYKSILDLNNLISATFEIRFSIR